MLAYEGKSRASLLLRRRSSCHSPRLPFPFAGQLCQALSCDEVAQEECQDAFSHPVGCCPRFPIRACAPSRYSGLEWWARSLDRSLAEGGRP